MNGKCSQSDRWAEKSQRSDSRCLELAGDSTYDQPDSDNYLIIFIYACIAADPGWIISAGDWEGYDSNRSANSN
ncbi:hypothetical protein PSSHI_35390 [Photobacterium sp. R1]